MMEFLEKFENSLEKEKMQGQLRMLNFACAAKARKRTVTLTRPSRDEPLQFAILGGFERGFGIFISRVEKGSKAEEIGLKRGDQVQFDIVVLSFFFFTKRPLIVETSCNWYFVELLGVARYQELKKVQRLRKSA